MPRKIKPTMLRSYIPEVNPYEKIQEQMDRYFNAHKLKDGEKVSLLEIINYRE